MSITILEINQGSTESLPIEAAVRSAFPRGQLLRCQLVHVDAPTVPDKWLALVNTQRTYGHFGVLEWNNEVGGLHSGHYFDSLTEVIADFNRRGGDVLMV